jgi:hypothetical protein
VIFSSRPAYECPTVVIVADDPTELPHTLRPLCGGGGGGGGGPGGAHDTHDQLTEISGSGRSLTMVTAWNRHEFQTHAPVNLIGQAFA